jgi:glycerol-3-phosphate acyltransferase PlsY
MHWVEQMQSVRWDQAGGTALGAYVLGCFTTGYYLVRWRTGPDLRELGSGNVGARNAGRALGWAGFLLTMVGDVVKGMLAVAAVQYLTRDQRLVGLAMVSVVAGHIWPVQLRFHGGKGIATSLGGLVVYDFRLALAVALSFAVLCPLVRRTMLAGLLAFACLPFVSVYLGRGSRRVWPMTRPKWPACPSWLRW